MSSEFDRALHEEENEAWEARMDNYHKTGVKKAITILTAALEIGG